jgi:Protein of unknown function (DUF3365)
MKNRWLMIALVIGLCASAARADDLATFRENSRAVVKDLASRLGGALQKELAADGPVAAIRVCRDIAPEITSDISRRTGMRVTRVSLKTRNPLLGSPDAWEQKVLLDFAARAEKEDPAALEYAEIVSEPQGTFMRYMKAIPVQPVCLKCHGTLGTISPKVGEQLSAQYPHDKATGYSLHQIRGAFSIKKAL